MKHIFLPGLLSMSLLFIGTATADEDLFGLPADSTPSINHSLIDGMALSGTRGRNTVNMATGDANSQLNAAAIAIGTSGAANLQSYQRDHLNLNTTPSLSRSAISGNAFSNSVGSLSINQTSGLANTQMNGVVIGIGDGINLMSESMLSSTNSGVGLATTEPDTGSRSATIADSAFTGSRGLVQVNQSAGSGNNTANSFALQLELGAN